jgi:hypothetical protein
MFVRHMPARRGIFFLGETARNEGSIYRKLTYDVHQTSDLQVGIS